MNKSIKTIVYGEPKGKGRPRFNRNSGVYSPRETVLYEKAIATAHKLQHKGWFAPKGVPIMMTITAYYKLLKQISKTKRANMLAGAIKPLKKPDIDNVVKVVCDALNGVAYYDDAQIVTIIAAKKFDESPRVEISIEKMGGYENETE